MPGQWSEELFPPAERGERRWSTPTSSSRARAGAWPARCVRRSSAWTSSWSSGRSTSGGQQHRHVDRDDPRRRQPVAARAGHRRLARAVPRRHPTRRPAATSTADRPRPGHVSARLVEWLADDRAWTDRARDRLRLPRPLGGRVPHRARPDRASLLDGLVRRVTARTGSTCGAGDAGRGGQPTTGGVAGVVAETRRRPRGDHVPGGAAGDQRLRRRRRARRASTCRRSPARPTTAARARAATPCGSAASSGRRPGTSTPTRATPPWPTRRHARQLGHRDARRGPRGRRGRRFGDETTGYSEYAEAVLRAARRPRPGWCSTSGSTGLPGRSGLPRHRRVRRVRRGRHRRGARRPSGVHADGARRRRSPGRRAVRAARRAPTGSAAPGGRRR